MLNMRTRKLIAVASTIAFGFVLSACSEGGINSPASTANAPGQASFDVVPAGGVNWIAPLGTGAADPSTFDAAAVTRVEICAWNGSACTSAPVAQFATVPPVGTGTLVVNTTAGQYEANWSLLSTSFLTRKTYRIRALNGATEVGSISVDVVRGRWALTRTDGTLAPLVAANELPIRFHVATAALPAIKVNEVESNGGVPGDWIELFNAGATTVDVSGFVIKDNDDTHSYALPAGTTMAAGAYLVVEEAALGYGLGAADAARVFTPAGAVVDSYSWTAHAATTYGRCPNGTGAFVTSATSTKGTPNDCGVPNTVRINEIESNGGTPGDWIELLNAGALAVDVSGFVIKDNDDTHSYTIPAGTVIAPGAYLVVEEAAFNFGLGAPDAARLFNNAAVLVDSYSWTTHATTTYGRCPDGTGAFVTMTSSTKGVANDCRAPNAVKINEVESNGGIPGDWIELYNTGSTAVDLSGYVVKDNDDTHAYTIPAGTSIAAGAYFVLEEAALDYGLGAADAARLFNPAAGLVDSYSWTAHAATTYGRCPNGTGEFVTSATPTKGTANDCGVPNTVRINEIESNGGTPGDWVELFNAGAIAVDVSGFVIKDNDDTHIYTIPAGTTIAPGAYRIVEEAALGYGLGAPDAVRLFNSAATLVDTYSWTTHATITYGRCPDGTGAFVNTTTSTKGASNDCSVPNAVKINEVESNGGTPGDWIEVYNTGTTPVDLSGYVVKDNDDTHAYIVPAGTVLAGGAYRVFEEAELTYGLGADDSARLFNPTGGLVDSYSWTTHAATTYGRCPNGTGAFTTTASSSKGTTNACTSTGPVTEPWPGSNTVTTVDGLSVFGGNLSGLVYESGVEGTPDVLWGARNGPGSLFRLIYNGSIWTPDTMNGWGAGKLLRYTDGTGEPDTEDVTFTTGSSAGMYIVSERNNSINGISRPSILRYDVSSAATTLTATNEWNLTADLPVVAANSGLEAITWVPDTYLLSQGFYDVAAGHLYNPAEYPNHAGGLFFVGLEGNGVVYVYALNHSTNAFKQIASVSTGFPSGVMALQFDRELGQLWATCDDTCGGLSAIFGVNTTSGSSTIGRLQLTHLFARPSGMPNINNEGFAFAPQSQCVGGFKPAFWADDSETGGHSIRQAFIPCVKFP